MRATKKLFFVAVFALGVVGVMAGPALAHTVPNKKGKPHGHGCGLGIVGQTSPPHRTHKHVHVGAHHGDVHEAREKHFHDHLCQPEPVASPSPSPIETAPVAAQSDGSSQDGSRSDEGSAAIVMLTGIPILAFLILTRNVRRRIVNTP